MADLNNTWNSIAEIAEQLGVSKKTAERAFDAVAEDLEGHVEIAARGQRRLDAKATAIVADYLAKHGRKRRDKQPLESSETTTSSEDRRDKSPDVAVGVEIYDALVKEAQARALAAESMAEYLKGELSRSRDEARRLQDLLTKRDETIADKDREIREMEVELRQSIATVGRIRSASVLQRIFGIKGLLGPADDA